MASASGPARPAPPASPPTSERAYLNLPLNNAAGVRSRAPRLLALHSFRTSAHIFKLQMKRAGWLLDVDASEGAPARGDAATSSPSSSSSAAEVVFLDAPFVATASPGAKIEQFFPDGPYREWWNASDDGRVYRGLDETLEYVNAFVQREGPFDGVIGFSQGGSLAALLCGLQQERRQLAPGSAPPPGPALTFPDFQLCICICGLRTRLKEHDRLYRDRNGSFQLPSLHFLGKADSLTPFSRRLVANFHDAVIIEHRHGHVVPSLAEAGARERLTTFLEKHCVVPSSATPSL